MRRDCFHEAAYMPWLSVMQPNYCSGQGILFLASFQGNGDSHGHGLAGAGLAAGPSVHRAVAAGPVVMAVADGIVGAGAMVRAVVEAAPLLGGRQAVAQLVDSHGVVDGRPPDALAHQQAVRDWLGWGHALRIAPNEDQAREA